MSALINMLLFIYFMGFFGMEDEIEGIKSAALGWMLNGHLKISRLRKYLRQMKAAKYAGLGGEEIAMCRGFAIALREYDRISRER